MNHVRVLSVAIALSLSCLMLGCASGAKYQDTMSNVPPLASNQGRIYFYRDGSPVGSAVQSDVYLNGKVVGRSVPGGFFYVDQAAPADCQVTCKTEAKRGLNFSLAPGETKYVRTRVKMGVLVGQIDPSLEDEAVAKKTLEKCKYIGEKN